MRTVLHTKLDEFSDQLVRFCEMNNRLLDLATVALLEGDEVAATEVIDGAAEVEDLREASEQHAFDLLLLEAPVARDLRQVVSGIYIVEHFTRMAALTGHIARVARRRHPNPVIPGPVVPTIREFAERDSAMARNLGQLLPTKDVRLARSLDSEDDAVDSLHADLMRQISAEDWPHGSVAAVDLALLARYYERFADHTVSIANRVVYLATGERPGGGSLSHLEDGTVLD
ncbi:MAG: PhoU domain-containing protein [Dietzia sp.]|jgi:phosphate transport system protein|uniref:Phosphate-specific transport system accessory protein PhoU n=1 Tax=Dietzia cercidiphylli TaxID=498199 RepID=A0ABN2J7G3_9ACTN|nr:MULTISPECIES: PhoU domain-containing protein [Dietzia]MBB1033357.1 phosphate uptake regulator PhoU [Dietzia sp. CQ4]MBB1038103.1 phosphate uptake regulator PhoU [Dietzia natronolimnaea]MBB1040819.1 phosphate uptake regulator PhoU [Dietzia sp. Cai40]MBB1044940.1 phosphate uptake regulator PhoU [Dietzia sp. DQ11-44]MBB1049218.1 phosphate uptake regulator PhoU [Dietzia cercidiphylli]